MKKYYDDLFGETITIIGKFKIVENGLFSVNEINYWKMDNNGEYQPYATKNILTGELKLFKPQKSNYHTMYLPNKIFWKMHDIYNLCIDNRINNFFDNDFIGEWDNTFVDNYGDLNQYEYYNLYYTDNDLLK